MGSGQFHPVHGPGKDWSRTSEDRKVVAGSTRSAWQRRWVRSGGTTRPLSIQTRLAGPYGLRVSRKAKRPVSPCRGVSHALGR